MTPNEIIKFVVDNKIFRVDMDTGFIINKDNRKIGYYNNQGREIITYKSEDKYKKIYSHRIVAYVKFGDELFNHETVDHIDGNCKNNHPDNLQLMSIKDNVIKKNTVDYPQLGIDNPCSKLTDEFVKEIKYGEINKTMNNKELARKYNVTHQMISRIRLGYNWSHI